MHERIVRLLLEGRDNLSGALQSASRSLDDYGKQLDNASRDSKGFREEMHNAEQDATTLGDAFRALRGESDGAGSSLRHLSHELRGIAFAAIIALAQDLITALVGLGGELMNVASSAAYAAGALGGLAAAGLVQAVPAIGLMIGAFGQLSGVLQAVQAKTKEQTQAGAADTQQMGAQRDASEAVRAAKENIREAEQNLSDARKDAIRDLQDLVAAEREAELAAQRSTLSLKEARLELQNMIKEGASPYEIRNAQLDLQEAQLDRRNSRRDLRRQRVDTREAVRGGVNNMPQVVAAQKALADATRSLADAQRGQAQAAQQSSGANTALQTALAGLSTAQRRLYRAILDFRDTADKLFTPITDIIVDSFTSAIRRVDSFLNSGEGKQVLSRFKGLAEAEADGISSIVDALLSDQVIEQLKFFTNSAQNSIKPVTNTLIALFKTFGNIAEAAMPTFNRAAILFEQWSVSLERSTRFSGGMERFFEQGLTHFRAWAELGGEVMRLFMALAGEGGAASTGLRALNESSEKIRETTQWVKENSDQVRTFFADAHEVTKQIMGVLGALGRELIRSFDPGRMEQVADALKNTFIPALGMALRLVGGLTNIIAIFLNMPVVSQISQIAIALGLAGSAASRLAVLIRALFVSGLGRIEMFVIKLAEARGATAAAAGGTSMLANAIEFMWIKWDDAIKAFQRSFFTILKWSALLAAAAYILVELEQKTEIFSKAVDFLTDPFDKFSRGVKIAIGVIEAFLALLVVGKLVAWARGLTGIAAGIRAITIAMAANPLGLLAIAASTALGAFLAFNNKQEDTKLKAEEVAAALREQRDAMRQIEDLQLEGGEKQDAVIFARAALEDERAALKAIRADADSTKLDIESAEARVRAAYRELQRAEMDWRDFQRNNKNFGIGADSGAWFPKGADAQKELRDKGVAPPPDLSPGGNKILENLKEQNKAQREANKLVEEFGELAKIAIPAGENEMTKHMFGEAMKRNLQELGANTDHLTASNEDLIDTYGLLNNKQVNTRDKSRLLNAAMEDSKDGGQRLATVVDRLTRKYDDFKDGVKTGSRELDKSKGPVDNARGGLRKFARTVGGVASNFGSFGGTVAGIVETVKNNVNKGLKEFGLQELKFAVDTKNPGAAVSAAKSFGSAVAGIFDGLTGGLATGGFVGMPGMRGRDKRMVPLGDGEAVLNWQQQRYANAALNQTYGFGLTELVNDKVKGYHAGGMGSRGYATGFSELNPAARELAIKLQAKGFTPTSTYRSDSTTYHGSGDAIDYGDSINDQGKLWSILRPKASQFAELFGPSYLSPPTLMHYGSGFSDSGLQAGHEDHIHLAILSGIAGKLRAGMNGLGGAVVPMMDRLKKIKVKGGGLLGGLTQKAADKLVNAANKFIDKKNAQLGGTGSAGYIPGGAGAVPLQMMRILMANGLDKVAAAGIVGNALQESGWNPASVGMGGGGLFGFTASPVSLADVQAFAESQGKPWTDVGVQVQFMLNHLPASLKAALNAATNVAESTALFMNEWERPYAPTANLERRIQGAQQAMSLRVRPARGQRFADGGEVKGRRKGQAVNVTAHEGEIILNEEQQEILGGKGFLKSLFGFDGAQRMSYADGGEVNVGDGDNSAGFKGPLWKLPRNIAFINRLTERLQRRFLAWNEDMGESFDGLLDTMWELPKTLTEKITKKNKDGEKVTKVVSTYDDFADGLQKIIGDGGYIDQMAAGMEEMRQRAQTALTFFTFKVVKGEVMRKFVKAFGVWIPNLVQVATRELGQLEREANSLNAQRSGLKGLDNKVAARIRRTNAAIEKLRENYRDAEDKEDRERIKKKIDQLKKNRDEMRGSREKIDDRIRALNAQIAENIAARYEKQTEIFDQRMANTFPEHKQKVLDLKEQIAQLTGDNYSPNQDALRDLNKQNRKALLKQQQAYEKMMEDAKKTNNKEEIQKLQIAMLENTLALLNNSKELEEINGQINSPQDFSSTAWQLFRKAIWNGQGGLLPQYEPLARQAMGLSSGVTGLTTAGSPYSNQSGNINVEINQAGEVVDPVGMANRLGFIMKTRQI